MIYTEDFGDPIVPDFWKLYVDVKEYANNDLKYSDVIGLL